VKTRKIHTVKANLQIFNLSKAGTSLELEVFAQESRTARRKIATVIIGRGSLTWKKGKGRRGRRITWSRLAEMMES
jgi:hypothetical protein